MVVNVTRARQLIKEGDEKELRARIIDCVHCFVKAPKLKTPVSVLVDSDFKKVAKR